MIHYYGTNRVVCDVLREMRECIKCLNFAVLPSLIEEAQTMVNRMEAAIGDKNDVKQMQEDRAGLKAEIKELEKKIKKLKPKKKEAVDE